MYKVIVVHSLLLFVFADNSWQCFTPRYSISIKTWNIWKSICASIFTQFFQFYRQSKNMGIPLFFTVPMTFSLLKFELSPLLPLSAWMKYFHVDTVYLINFLWSIIAPQNVDNFLLKVSRSIETLKNSIYFLFIIQKQLHNIKV